MPHTSDPLVRASDTVAEVSVVFPVFVAVTVKAMVSPASSRPVLFASTMAAAVVLTERRLSRVIDTVRALDPLTAPA